MDRWEVGPNYPFRRPDCSLQSVLVLTGDRSKPDIDGGAEDRLDDGCVEGDQQLLQQVKLPELSQEVEPLLSLFADRIYADGQHVLTPDALGALQHVLTPNASSALQHVLTPNASNV